MKRNYMKTLLVAAGLLVGSNGAWSAETWDFTNSETWGSVVLPTADKNSVSYNANGEEATTGNRITFYSTNGNIVHPTTATNGIAFSATGSTSDNYVKLTVPAGCAASVTAYVSSNRNVTSIFGSETFKFAAGWAEVTHDYDNTSGTEDVDLYIYCSANAGGVKQAPYLRKIVLQSAVPVTINYKDEEDNTIATSVTEFIEVGENYTPTYKNPYYVSDEDSYTYTYKSGGDTQTITGSTTIDIIYSKSARSLYTITTIKEYGGKSETAYADVYEGATYTYYYPRFVLDGTTLYKYKSSTDANASSSYWTSTLTNVQEDATYTLSYEAIPGTCVYYAEGEDIEGASKYENATFVARSSNSGIGVLSSATIASLEAGVYTITTRVIGRADRSVDFFMGSTEGTKIMNAGSATTGNETTSDIFTLSEATDIVANGGYVTTSENGHGFDYIYIMKPVISATITSAGYATFFNANALDFKAAGVTAYIITGVDGTTLQLESVDDVPANTPVVLEGNEGSYSIPVIASSETDVTANKLVGVSADTPAIEGTYVLQTQSSGTGFYKVGTENIPTVTAGKAYLNYTAPGAKAFYFDNNATAIEAISALTSDAIEGIYTVGGAKVSSLQKGINIVKMQNGTTQKVLVK